MPAPRDTFKRTRQQETDPSGPLEMKLIRANGSGGRLSLAGAALSYSQAATLDPITSAHHRLRFIFVSLDRVQHVLQTSTGLSSSVLQPSMDVDQSIDSIAEPQGKSAASGPEWSR